MDEGVRCTDDGLEEMRGVMKPKDNFGYDRRSESAGTYDKLREDTDSHGSCRLSLSSSGHLRSRSSNINSSSNGGTVVNI